MNSLRCFTFQVCEHKICLVCDQEEHAGSLLALESVPIIASRCLWHAGVSCEQHALWKRENAAANDKFEELFTQGLLKPCPNCKKPIMKNEGVCNPMQLPTHKCCSHLCCGWLSCFRVQFYDLPTMQAQGWILLANRQAKVGTRSVLLCFTALPVLLKASCRNTCIFW